MIKWLDNLFAETKGEGDEKVRIVGANSGLSAEVNRADWWRTHKDEWAAMDEVMRPIIKQNQRKTAK